MARGYSIRAPRPNCPECGGKCGMFVEHGQRGDFQVIHCLDTEACCWHWVPDGAGIVPPVGPETIASRIWAHEHRAAQDDRGKVIGAIAGSLACILDDPAFDQPEVLYQKLIHAGRLQALVGIAFAIRHSRKLCGCKLQRDHAWKDTDGNLQEEVTPLDFDDPDNHDSHCAVGAALRIISDALDATR